MLYYGQMLINLCDIQTESFPAPRRGTRPPIPAAYSFQSPFQVRPLGWISYFFLTFHTIYLNRELPAAGQPS